MHLSYYLTDLATARGTTKSRIEALMLLITDQPFILLESDQTGRLSKSRLQDTRNDCALIFQCTHWHAVILHSINVSSGTDHSYHGHHRNKEKTSQLPMSIA